MAVIVGAACQPLQPADFPAGNSAPATGATQAGPPAWNPGSSSGMPAGAPAGIAGAGITTADAPLASGPLVALLVPLSGRQEALGTAVRDGFVAALLEAPASRRFNAMIIDEARISAAEAHRQALDAGARAMVGPLLRESVQALAPLADELTRTMPGQMPVLGLNNLADTEPGVGGLWQFGLAPEDEAGEIAARAIALGQRRALVLLPASEWGQRLLAAFSAEFTARGGVVVDARTYLPGGTDFTVPIRSLLMTTEPRAPAPGSQANPGEKTGLGPGRRQDVDLIFVAANSSNGRQIVPQLKFFGAADLPTYSTSAIWEDGTTNADDLNGVVFPDSPWVIDPDSRALVVKNALARYWGRPAPGVSRLYALGYDAYRLLPEILRQPAPGPFGGGELAGTTGVLYADGSGRIHRRLSFAEIRGGRAVPLPSVAAMGGP
ncbi:MAG: penicillin-binding protein activator [Chromatiales bacterium]|nr:penicillin-binding protein activator [Chromatiales bacterium]